MKNITTIGQGPWGNDGPVTLPQRLAHQVRTQLADQADPVRAEGEKRYLKSEIDHFGVPVPAVRKAVTAVRKEHPALGHDDVVDLVRHLWSDRMHECRLAAALLLGAYVDRLSASDVDLLEELIREAGTWALVDVLAGDVGGRLLLGNPQVEATYRRWGDDDDMWMRRSGILGFLVPLRDPTKHARYFGVFTEIADDALTDSRFFVRKAIGWVLREVGKRHPDDVFAWLVPRVPRVSGVTLREAVKYLSSTQRDELTTAYRSR